MHARTIVAAAALLALATAAPARPRHGPPAVGDLEGVWTSASYTQLERPKSLTSLVLTPEEASAYEASVHRTMGVVGHGPDVVGQGESEFAEAGDGLARIHGEIRSSWIVDPADGQLPLTAEGKRLWKATNPFSPESMEGPEGRPQSERCISSNGSGPPLVSEQDANLLQIVQTKTRVAIVSEKNHETRIIPLDRVRDPHAPPTWAGEAIGRWEGRTLVVETSGFRQALVDRDFMIHSDGARMEERFTRLSPTEILYAFTVTDPKIYTRPWRAEMLLRATKGRMFEYACHEGNRAIVNVLAAARAGLQEPPKPKPPASATPAAP